MATFKGRLALSVLAAALPMALVACSGSSSAPSSSSSSGTTATQQVQSAATTAATPAGPQVLEVKTGDREGGFFQDPKNITVRPGTIRITLVNQSAERPHNLVLRDRSGKELAKGADRVAVGQRDTFEFSIQDEGTYELYCSITGHLDRGATSSFVVQKAAQ